MSLLVLISIVSVLLSVSAVVFLILRFRWERQKSADELKNRAAVVLDPVVKEAQSLQAAIGPLLVEVGRLRDTVVEGRVRSEKDREAYEARIKTLETLIARVIPGYTPGQDITDVELPPSTGV